MTDLTEPSLPADHPPVDAARYRQVLGHFATGITVITTDAGAGEPVGLAANSFTSVSLDPPLVAFCAAHTSATWEHIRRTRTFCVNVLSAEQEDVCRVFAGKGDDKFRGIGWRPGPSGAPVLDHALAWIDCRIEAEHQAGDHVIVVGRVLALAVDDDEEPLLFYRGGYARLVP